MEAARNRIRALERQKSDIEVCGETEKLHARSLKLHGLWEMAKLMPISETGWERIVLTVDSGAADTVMPASISKLVPISRSPKLGTQYEAANGGVLVNLGGKKCNFRTGPDMPELLMSVQIVDVHKPLLAASKIVEAGNAPVFSKDDPHIQIKNGPKLPMKCVNGTYELEMWVKNEPDGPEAGFTGPRR